MAQSAHTVIRLGIRQVSKVPELRGRWIYDLLIPANRCRSYGPRCPVNAYYSANTMQRQTAYRAMSSQGLTKLLGDVDQSGRLSNGGVGVHGGTTQVSASKQGSVVHIHFINHRSTLPHVSDAGCKWCLAPVSESPVLDSRAHLLITQSIVPAAISTNKLTRHRPFKLPVAHVGVATKGSSHILAPISKKYALSEVLPVHKARP